MVESSKTLRESDKALKDMAANLDVDSRRRHGGFSVYNSVTTIVISVQETVTNCKPCAELALKGKKRVCAMNCLSCAYACRIPKNMDYKANGSESQLKKFQSSFKGCREQFINAHAEGDEVADFYRSINNGKCMRLKDPSAEALDDVLNAIVADDYDEKEGTSRHHHGEAVMIYYIGHGVEHNNHTHAVLKDGDRRVKYDLEKMVNRIGRHRLAHVMFDCNRLYLNHVLPQKEKKYPNKHHFLYSYTTHAGRETKALNSVRTYIDHMTS